jgi:hypothetical protein
MPSLGARLVAYLFVGIICAAGPFLLLIAGVTAIQRVIFLHTAQPVEGQVIALRQAPTRRSSRPSYFPIFAFKAADGQTYTVTSNIADRQTAWLGKPVRVLYLPHDPQTARIDTFAQLWEGQIIPAVIGAAFSTIPLLILFRRRAAPFLAPQCRVD